MRSGRAELQIRATRRTVRRCFSVPTKAVLYKATTATGRSRRKTTMRTMAANLPGRKYGLQGKKDTKENKSKHALSYQVVGLGYCSICLSNKAHRRIYSHACPIVPFPIVQKCSEDHGYEMFIKAHCTIKKKLNFPCRFPIQQLA